MNFPSRHPLQRRRARRRPTSCSGSRRGDISNVARAGAASATRRCISIIVGRISSQRSNYQDFVRYADVDLAIAADAEATLPALIEAIKRQTTAARRERSSQRGAEARRRERADVRARTKADGDVRLGREPDQHRAAVGGALGADQERGLVARDGLGELAAASLGLRQALPVHRPRGRRGRRLLRAGLGRRGAREQEARPAQRRRSSPTAT